MEHRALYDHVIAKRIVLEAKSAGGILLTSSGEFETYRAEVVSVGTGMVDEMGKHHPMAVKVGDIITFSEHEQIHTVHIEGTEYLVMKEECIVGVNDEYDPAEDTYRGHL